MHKLNTVIPFNVGCLLYVMKNWLPLVFGFPLLAIDTMPRFVCFRASVISSVNLPLGVE